MRKALLFLPLLFLLVPIVNAGITYSAPTITLTSGTYSFLDIYNADVAGGWGVVTKTSGDRQFQFDAMIKVGDGTNANKATLTDKDKQITFLDTAITTAQANIDCTRYSTLILGELVNAPSRIVRFGCQILSLETLANVPIIRYTGTTNLDGGVYLYGCTIAKAQSGAQATYVYYPARMWGGSVVNAGIRYTRSDTSICDIIMYNNYIALINIYAAAQLDNILILSSPNGIYGQNDDSTYRNIDYRGTGNFLRSVNLNAWIYLINCVAPEPWTTSFTGTPVHGAFLRQYTWNTLIKDNLGLPIQNATIILYRLDGTLAFAALTAVDGTISEQTVTRGFYNQTGGNTMYDYGPFTLQIEAPGYLPHTIFNITLGEPIDWTIALSTVQITTTIPLSFLVFTSIASIITIYGYKNQIPRERMLAFGFGILFWFAVIWQWVSDNTGTSTLMLVTIFLAPLFACFAWFMQSLGVYIDKINSKEEYDVY